MSENKKQHFVPQFYLKNFSFDNGSRTNLLRVDEMTIVPAIPLGPQCQEDYFYGKDLILEKALSSIEGDAAAIVRDIIGNGSIAGRGTEEDCFLKLYVCLQWARTRAFSDGLDSGFSKMVKTAFSERFKGAGFSQSDLERVEISREAGPADAVRNGADFIPFFTDLEPKLVWANGHGQFVASDDPVVLVNPFYFGRFPGGIAGPALEGTVILLPLSPEFLAIFYDRRCYRVGAPASQSVPLASASDLNVLNNYVFLNASKNIYFHDSRLSGHFLSEFSKVAKLRNPDRHVVRKATAEDGNSLIHNFTEPIKYKPPTSFLKVLRARRGEIGQVSQIPDRDPALSQQFTIYSEGLCKGKIPRGFVKYLANIADVILSEEEKARLNARARPAAGK